MYKFGFYLGKTLFFLFEYKWYVLATIVYIFIMSKLKDWLQLDTSLVVFIEAIYILWLVMEIRTSKLHDERVFSPTIRYLKWYAKNLKVFVKGE